MPRRESMYSCLVIAISNMGEISLYMYSLCDISSSPNFLKFEVKTGMLIQTTRS